MDKDIAGRNGPRRVTYMEIKRIVLTVASVVLNPGMSSFFSLMPISLWFHWSVRVSFDVDCYSEHIRNSQVKHNDQVTKELECLSKFYKPENGRWHNEPMAVVDCHGWILLWYLPEVLSTTILVRVNSLDELYHGLITQHTLPGQLQHQCGQHSKLPLTTAGKQVLAQ